MLGKRLNLFLYWPNLIKMLASTHIEAINPRNKVPRGAFNCYQLREIHVDRFGCFTKLAHYESIFFRSIHSCAHTTGMSADLLNLSSDIHIKFFFLHTTDILININLFISKKKSIKATLVTFVGCVM